MAKTLAFNQAVKVLGGVAFSAMIKPVGSACNLRCDYCYYLDKERLHNRGVISDELMERFVSDYIRSNSSDEVTFCFHGGEPLMAPLSLYERVMGWQREYAGQRRVVNTIQTNGTLIDERWAEFFAANDFLVGVSIDGPQAVHNARRGASWSKAMRGLECLQRAGVEFNTLSAVSSASVGQGVEIYRFLKSIGSHFMQFLPVAEFVDEGHIATSGQIAPFSITGKEWGRFCIDIFDEWVLSDVGERFVSLFDATLAGYCGVQPGVCVFGESCGTALVVEHTGDTYCCDHFVYDEYRLGSIVESSIADMIGSSQQFRFGASKSDGVSKRCRACAYWVLCHGECPKHRDANGDNVLCDGYAAFFAHSRPYFELMREKLEQGIPASAVMSFARDRMGF